MNIELLKQLHRQARIDTNCPTTYLPLSIVSLLSSAAELMRGKWDPSCTTEPDQDEAWQIVKDAFGQVLVYYRDVDLEEVSKAIPAWKQLAEKAEQDPSKLIADAFMDAMGIILGESNSAYKATAIFGVLCAVLGRDPEELLM